MKRRSKKHLFLWLRNRTTENRKGKKAQNIKGKWQSKNFNTVSRLHVVLPSSPSADYISDATLRLCFGRAVFCCPLFRRTGEHDCASPAVAPQGASRRRLLIFAQASRAKTKSMGLRLFCKLFVNPIDKAGGQEYIFSSRADRVLKTKQPAPQEVCKTMKKNICIINSRLCRRRARSC